jgi:hypothetical protein
MDLLLKNKTMKITPNFNGIKKVICDIVDNYGNDEFTGPDPKKGDVLTVI